MAEPLQDHKINPLNDLISIVPDERDPENGNASHAYRCGWTDEHGFEHVTEIFFQQGPIGEQGINGLSNEALLAIVIDRLRGFQSGKWPCRENAIALTKVEEAMHWLHARTRARMARGVEGTSAT